MPEFIELTKLILVLASVIIGYILTGIANNCLVKDEKFEISILIKGIVKTLTACLGLIIVSYVCTIIDLTSLGFKPQTAITSGIVVYTTKLIRNAFGLLGLSKNGKDEDIINTNISQKLDDDKSDIINEKENNDFIEVDIHGNIVEKSENNFKSDSNAVG